MKYFLPICFILCLLLFIKDGKSVWTNGTVKFLEVSDTISILATAFDLSGVSGGSVDTVALIATKTDILALQADSDTNSWDATVADLGTKADSSLVLYWTDTTLSNGVVTNYDLGTKADSGTALYWTDTTSTIATTYDLSLVSGGSYTPYTRSYGYLHSNIGTTTYSTVGIAVLTSTATVASNPQTFGHFTKHTSAATANTPTGLISGFSVMQRRWEPEFYCSFLTDTKIDSVCFSIGFTSAAFDTNRAPNRYEIKFGYHTGVDTKWTCITNNNAGGSQTKTVTSVTPAANTLYVFKIVCSNTTPDVKFYINDVLEATHTTQLPTNTQALGYGIRIIPRFTTGTSARVGSCGKLMINWVNP